MSKMHVASTRKRATTVRLRYLFFFNRHPLYPTTMNPQTLSCMNVDFGQSRVGIAPTPVKRRKTARSDVPITVSKPKQRKGKLSKLPDMPLDVLYEVNSSRC